MFYVAKKTGTQPKNVAVSLLLIKLFRLIFFNLLMMTLSSRSFSRAVVNHLTHANL